jgi:hypothetical protein
VKLIALIFILNLTAFFAEVTILPLIQCNAMYAKKTDGCSKCNMKHNTCKDTDKKSNDSCNKNVACFSCPLCSVFLAHNFNETPAIQSFHKIIYSFYTDNLISVYVSETWKPPNVC